MTINFFELLKNVNGNTFISIDTEVDVPLEGESSKYFQRKVKKCITGSNVMVFQNKRIHGYESMIKRRLIKEGKDPDTFILSPRSWGKRIPNLPLVKHKGNLYLEVIFLHSGKVSYFLNKKPISKSEIPGLPYHKEAYQGGLENKVIVRTFNVKNIKAMSINGKKYTKEELNQEIKNVRPSN